MIQSKADTYKKYAISAILAKFAYSDPDSISDLWFKMRDSKRDSLMNVFRGVKDVPEFYSSKETGAQAFSIIKNGILYIVFRGTESSQDVVINLDIARVPLLPNNKYILVHQGFLKQFNSLKDDIVKKIKNTFLNINEIICIGHSLGGALATLAAGYLGCLYKNDHEIICHTFGSPRVGNKHFMRWFQENVKSSENARIINHADPVSQIPLSSRFEHVSDALCIMDNLTVKNLPDTKWYWRLLGFRSKCCNPVLAHSCDQYIECLMKIYMS